MLSAARLLLLLALPHVVGAAAPRLVPQEELGALQARTPREALSLAAQARGAPAWPAASFVPLSVMPIGNGLTQHSFAQELNGVPVFRGTNLVFTDARDQVVGIKLGELPDKALPGPFVLDASEAVASAIATVQGANGASALAERTVLASGSTSAWRVTLALREDPAAHFVVLVDAATGQVLQVFDITDHAAARGRVFPAGMLRGSELRDFVDTDLVLSASSPAGWVAADMTEGNNAYAEDDRTGDQGTTPGLRAQGTGDPLLFDFPVTGLPLDDLDAALTNAFWAVNTAHDRFEELGFNASSGACQTANYGQGGLGNDRTRVFVQYRAGAAATGIRNTSTASSGGDGSTNTLTLGLWDTSGTIRDGALDTGLIFHEYAHLVVIRLAGADATCDDGTQPSGLAEGWADYFAASWTGDTVIGAYVSGNTANGLRTLPIDRNSYGYGNLCYILGDYCDRFQNGEIWAGALWDLRTRLIALYGAEAGARRADRLILEGLRWTPCRPTYLAARDGLVAADLAASGGADRCVIWGALAMRGMGVSATTSGPDDVVPLPGYDLPAECRSGASLGFERTRYGTDADARLVVADGTPGAPARDVAVTSSSGDSETFMAAAGPLVRSLVVPLRAGPAVPGDGMVQVADGDTVQAACPACPGAPRASASIRRALAVTVNSHQVTSDTCQPDTLADFPFPELPGLVDAGEAANVTVTLGNSESFPLEGVRVRVTCDNPHLQVLPSSWIPVGSVRERTGIPRAFTARLRVLAAPSGTLAFGEVANLTLDVEARGLAGQAQLRLILAADYAVERAVSAWGGAETFENGSPTAAAWTHAPAYGRPSDQWSIQSCGDGGGRAMVYGGAGCGDYLDTASAATLVSPPLIDMGGGSVQAVHPLSASWRNEVVLGVDPTFPNYCDSDMVLLYMTDNPARPAYANPIGDRNNAAQYWVQWPGLGDSRNTTGYATGATRLPITTTSFSGMVPANVRLYWAFMTDVYNSSNNGGCDRETDSVGAGYRLDNVLFTYDRVRVVPQADATCGATCTVRAVIAISPAGGSRCAGEPVVLDASLSEAAGCGGPLEYRFTGPATDTGYTSSPVATVVAAPNATWTVAVRCAGNTACSQSASQADPTLDDSMAGRVVPASLRVHRSGDDIVLQWLGTRSPVAYAVFRGDFERADAPARPLLLTDLGQSPPPDALRNGSPNALEHLDAGAARGTPSCRFYRVLSRSPCSGTASDR